MTTIRVRYQQLGTEAWRYMGGVMVRSENAQGQELEPNTDSNGYAEVYCGPGSITTVLTHIRGKIKVVFRYSLTNKSGVAAQIVDVPCGTTPVVTAKRQMANAWVAMRKIETRLRTGFGQSRTPIDVVIYNEDRVGAYQYGFDERIKLGLNHFLNFDGFRTMAHEYGHAFHNEALGGYEKGGCPSPHYLDGAHGLRCALSEGFADFAAPLAAETLMPSIYGVSPVQLPSYWSILRNNYYPGNTSHSTRPDLINDGSVIEGAVAAFFWDLYDGENSPEEGNESDYDRTEYPLSYIGDVMATCLVKYPNYAGLWRKEWGIDHLLTCFQEEKVSYASPFFARRLERGSTTDESYTDFSVSATKPPDWSRNDIEILWKKTFYGINPPPPQPLSVSIFGPSSCQVGQTCTWTANVSGGSGPTSYNWQWRRSCLSEPLDSEWDENPNGIDPKPQDVPVCEWAGGGTNQSYSLNRSQTGPIDVKVTVTRGSETASRIKSVSIVSGASLTADGGNSQEGVEHLSSIGASLTTMPPPDEVVLEGARPNPFVSDTEIVFGLPEETHVRLAVFDLLGRVVARLEHRVLPAGWHSAKQDGSILSAGIYVVRLMTNEEMRSMRITRIQ